MTDFLFAKNAAEADRAARAQGWRSAGNGVWFKPGRATDILFIYLTEQLEAIGQGDTVYIAGSTTREVLRAINHRGGKCVRLK